MFMLILDDFIALIAFIVKHIIFHYIWGFVLEKVMPIILSPNFIMGLLIAIVTMVIITAIIATLSYFNPTVKIILQVSAQTIMIQTYITLIFISIMPISFLKR